METATAVRRAIGIVRVSQTNGREGDSFASPPEQRDRITAACKRDHLRLLRTTEEMDVSGGTPLEQRTGLREAVEAVEAGEADVIVAAYFDRLCRSLRVQGELIERVEAAGGQVLAVDVGRVTNGSAGQWLSGTMLGAVSEYQRRTSAERSGEAQQRAINRGVLPYPNVPPGLRRVEEGPRKGCVEPDPETEAVAVSVFAMRADGATVADVRAFLAANGVERSYHGVASMLASRLYRGEIHFGHYAPNLSAHRAIIDADTFARVQRARVSRGRKSKSERLLARLGVLRCGTCGARMVVGTSNNSAYWIYRCPPTGDCTRRVTISAEIVEHFVVTAVRAALADQDGRASIEDNAREADAVLDRAQQALVGAISAFTGLEDETSARDRLAELRGVRDVALERVEHLRGSRSFVTINAARDWERLSLDARRALVRAVVARVLVAPGRGADRITVEMVTE